MQVWVCLDDDLLLEFLFQRLNALPFLVIEHVGDNGINGHERLPLLGSRKGPAKLPKYLVADGAARLHVSAAVTVRARLAEDASQALPYALAGHLNEPERRDMGDRGLGLVADERFLERRINLPPVVLPFHIDEVQDDDAAD